MAGPQYFLLSCTLRRLIKVIALKRLAPGLATVAGFLFMFWTGCAMMPEEEPVAEEVAILFTSSTGGEIEPCG